MISSFTGSIRSSLDIVRSGLRVYLRPEGVAGSTWTDQEGRANGTLYNTPGFITNQGCSFNGTNEYGRIPSVSGSTDFTASNNYSIEIWLYINSTQPDTGNPDNCIFEKWNDNSQGSYPYVFRFIRSNTTISMACYNGSQNPGTTVSVLTNNWMQVVGVFDHTNNLLSGYVNGGLSNTGAMSISGTISNSSTVNIARRGLSGGGGHNYFAGRVGIVRIYNRALSALEVSQNYKASAYIYDI